MASLSDAYPTGNRYHLHAYVCGGACVRRVDTSDPPTCTFRQVFTNRPDGCRYAVVSQWDMMGNKSRYLVFDLFRTNAKFSNDAAAIIPPKPRLVHDDLDAAIMGTVMLYNDTL